MITLSRCDMVKHMRSFCSTVYGHVAAESTRCEGLKLHGVGVRLSQRECCDCDNAPAAIPTTSAMFAQAAVLFPIRRLRYTHVSGRGPDRSRRGATPQSTEIPINSNLLVSMATTATQRPRRWRYRTVPFDRLVEWPRATCDTAQLLLHAADNDTCAPRECRGLQL